MTLELINEEGPDSESDAAEVMVRSFVSVTHPQHTPNMFTDFGPNVEGVR